MTMLTADYRNAHLPAEVRADLLLREMTLEEKCAQLTAVLPWWLIRWDGTDAEGAAEVFVASRSAEWFLTRSADDVYCAFGAGNH